MTKKQKRLILLNIPYVLMGLFATNLGEAWRISQTIDAVNEVGYRLEEASKHNDWEKREAFGSFAEYNEYLKAHTPALFRMDYL